MNVEDLLNSKSIPYTPKNDDFIVQCLNPEHEDRNPSMRIDKLTGIFNCFSCGFKGNIFSLYGKTPNKLEQKRLSLKNKINEKRSESIGLEMPKGYAPYVGTWRGIRSVTYKEFGAFKHPGKEFVSRICFPIRDHTGRIVAFQGRSEGLEPKPKYLTSPKGVKLPLFPAVQPIHSSIILVEGIFDVLNLHDKGLTNAVCCFGVKNITVEKLNVLSMKGIDQIYIYFDEDEAGQKSAHEVKTLCEEAEIEGSILRYFPEEHSDPGSLSAQHIEYIKEKLYG